MDSARRPPREVRSRGDTLYPVKEFRESVQLWFARSPEAKIVFYTDLVKERAEEVQKVSAKQRADVEAISRALIRLDEHLIALNEVVGKNVKDETGGEVVADAKFSEALEKVVAGQQAAGDLLEGSLDDVPPEALLRLQSSLEAIRSARERVNSALDALGPIDDSDQ